MMVGRSPKEKVAPPMNDRLLSPPPACSAAAGIEMWIDLVGLGDELVETSFRRQYGPDDWIEPYRKMAEKLNKEKDQRLENLLHRLTIAEPHLG
jgi:hypothetical protein